MGGGPAWADETTAPVAAGQSAAEVTSPTAAAAPASTALGDVVTSGALKYQDLKVGTGIAATRGKNISIHYKGTTTEGQLVDDSRIKFIPTPLNLVLGTNTLVPGMELGIVGMKVGGMRRITIPPELGYGSRAMGDLPANSTLIFDVELVAMQE
ncbi:peptidylprolyl isomerase [candidate division BRC1 bacterium HGW-BRC1-1]|nr:MAG: peptidylprolyl isomerase [candidate division BRC1 bacterium HGW-BRC1-1]